MCAIFATVRKVEKKQKRKQTQRWSGKKGTDKIAIQPKNRRETYVFGISYIRVFDGIANSFRTGRIYKVKTEAKKREYKWIFNGVK